MFTPLQIGSHGEDHQAMKVAKFIDQFDGDVRAAMLNLTDFLLPGGFAQKVEQARAMARR